MTYETTVVTTPSSTTTEQEPRVSKNVCANCGASIKLMCRVGTGICGENCEKAVARS